MKLANRQIDGFLRAPGPNVRAVLVYGPDEGLVSERVKALVHAVAEDAADPFRVADLVAAALKDDPAALADEATALSFTGGRRAIRVRDAGDAHRVAFENFFAAPVADSLVVADAGNLGPRSTLRRLFEQREDAAALPCYADDGASLGEVIAETLSAAGLTAEPAATAYLRDHLGSDRQLSRRELEKLVLYMGSAEGPATVTLDDVLACVGDSAALSLDDVAFAAAGGDVAFLERALGRTLSEGNTPVAVLRAVLRHFHRLHLVSGARDQGASVDQAMNGLQPKVFFKQADAFRRQLGHWTTARLARAIDLLLEAERRVKSTGSPDQAICSRTLMQVAMAARGGRRR